MAALCDAPELQEALRRIELAASGVRTLHLGPIDYNVATTRDDLMAAIGLIEEFGRHQPISTESDSGR